MSLCEGGTRCPAKQILRKIEYLDHQREAYVIQRDQLWLENRHTHEHNEILFNDLHGVVLRKNRQATEFERELSELRRTHSLCEGCEWRKRG